MPLLKSVLRRIRRPYGPSWGPFWRERGGNVAIMFGLSLLPMVLGTGAAVDMGQAMIVRSRLAHALDAAALAVGRQIYLPESELTSLATTFFEANYPKKELGVPGKLSVRVGSEDVSLSAKATVKTKFMGLAGIDQITVGATSQVKRSVRGLEVVMVLDHTSSMNKGKMETMKEAARSLVKTLFGDVQEHPHLKIGFVPFLSTVNIKDEDAFKMTWMDTEAKAKYHGVNFENASGDDFETPDNGPVNHFDLFDDMTNVSWYGCVESRPDGLDMTDDEPATSNPNTLFVPWLWPDSPDKKDKKEWKNYFNDYVKDNRGFTGNGGGSDDGDDTNGLEEFPSNDPEARERTTAKYAGSVNHGKGPTKSYGPNRSCPQPLTPLTNKRSEIDDAIDEMERWTTKSSATGTNVPVGLAWGWRVISPGEPFTQGVPYDDPDVDKAIIVLTDGENFIMNQKTDNKSDYTSFGFMNEKRLGTDNRGQARKEYDNKTAQLCENIKDQDIRVYSITFQVKSKTTEKLFQDCATEPELYFHSPTNAELESVFQQIAVDLSNLRLSQ